ncbi:hypothetical protein ACFW0U_07360 [Streptomyces albidoflavus]
MQNNRVYIDGRLMDVSTFTPEMWRRLTEDNRNSTKRHLVKCAWCWQEDHVTHWMKTYSTSSGARVVSHQPGESGDHPYQALESDEHKATCDRVERVWTAEGGTALREALAPDGRTRSDVLLIGSLVLSYEMQHSPFSRGYGATERTRRALKAGRDAVAWHTDSDVVAGRAQVAMLRSNKATRPQIESPRYELRILGGYRKVRTWTCSVREGYRCPNGRFSGCGKAHIDTEPAAISLDGFVRAAPLGLVAPVTPLARQGFWASAADVELWQQHTPPDGASPGVDECADRRRRYRPGGHSRRRAHIPTDAMGQPIPPCRFCGRPASMPGPEGSPEHYTCRITQPN